MFIPNILVLLLATLGFVSTANSYTLSNVHARELLDRRQNNQNNNNNNNNNAADLALNPANVQSNSALTGQEAGDDPAQADSAVDKANFINFCTGKTLTNGLQVQGGSCNGIVMGDIPSTQNMVSSIITSPTPGQDIAANTAFTIQVQVTNLQAGSFTNPANTYYAAPQALQGGKIVGHTHVTVQDLGGSLTPNNAPDAGKFEFFKGINDAGNGNGLLSADVTGGLPAGFYRVCTMTSASNHQPVLMPIAQRGAQDDCTKFTVGQGNGNNGNNNNNNANNGANNNNNNANAGNQGQNQVAVEIAGYLRSSLFAPLSSNITRLRDECNVSMSAQKDILQDVQSQISNVIEPAAAQLIPIATELNSVYQQIDLLEVGTYLRLPPPPPPPPLPHPRPYQAFPRIRMIYTNGPSLSPGSDTTGQREYQTDDIQGRADRASTTPGGTGSERRQATANVEGV
ncbi:hypothetical protein DFP73DRAFT_487512 [Morchella snyderi]|nr:hypothetical protein DFP73DRAFT_487512 [Morchella snyderi]